MFHVLTRIFHYFSLDHSACHQFWRLSQYSQFILTKLMRSSLLFHPWQLAFEALQHNGRERQRHRSPLSHKHLHISGFERLRRRARLLNSGVLASLRGGLCATLLLAIVFATELLGLKYAYGTGLLFMTATFFLGFALFRFSQEARISLSETDEFE
jgi:hypothetical protein